MSNVKVKQKFQVRSPQDNYTLIWSEHNTIGGAIRKVDSVVKYEEKCGPVQEILESRDGGETWDLLMIHVTKTGRWKRGY